MWLCVLLLFLKLGSTFGEDEVFLGALFDENPHEEEIFKTTVNYLNSYSLLSFTFAPLTRNIDDRGPYGALKNTCDLLSNQAVVIFGPKNEENVGIVEATCDNKDIPHVITRWMHSPVQRSTLINFYPHSKYLTAAYLSILSKWKWRTFTVYYDDNESILRMSELIRDAKDAGFIVSVKQLDEEGRGIYRPSLKQGLVSGERHFVIDCKIEILEKVLRHAQQVGMMTSDFNYFITNLDLQTIDLESFQYSGAYISGIRLVDPENKHLQLLTPFLETESLVRTETALLIDAVSVLTQSIEEHGDEKIGERGINCNSTKGFRHGATISSIVKGGKYFGLTGAIEFDNEGLRSNFDLDVLELHEDGIEKVGTWNYTNGISTIPKPLEVIDEDPNSLKNKTFIVITCLTDPYCMLKVSPFSLTGNDRFEGFGVDLIHELSLIEGFNYTFIIREDKNNGKKDDETGEWTGMIGDVMSYKADLAITDLTINADRVEAVDFTEPFMNLGISILGKKPKTAPPSFFSFADPFAIDTWVGLAVAYVFVSFSFFIIGRMCPDEWTNPYPCVEEPEYLVNQFTLQNASWLAMGTLMQQGSEVAPIGISTRMVAAFWWFFILIIVSSYTANLAAFLATENPIELFTDIQSLVENMKKYNIRVGAKAGGATEGFFKTKDEPVYKAIADYMAKHTDDMVKDNKDGVRLAEEQTYAFFMESTSIEYEVQRHCELQQYGKLLDEKGYGIAMRKNSPYRKRLSTAILKLQSSGEIDKLKRRWWEEKRGGGQCTGEEEEAAAKPLHPENLEGCFYVTIYGTIISVVFVLIEAFAAIIRLKKRAKISFREAFNYELKAFLNFNSNVKPVITAESGSKSSSGTPKGSASNNNLKPELPYGFIPAITREEFKDKSS